MKIWLVAIGGLMLLAGCAENRTETVLEDIQPEIEVIAEHLEAPWAIEKLGDTFYITERAGAIIQIENDESSRQEVQLTEIVSTAAEAGLLGFVLAPNFGETKEAFAYYTYDKDGQPMNRVVRLRFEEDVWSEQAVLIDRIPSGTYHHGGHLQMGPDGKLYVTTGDTSNPELAQDKESLAGKVLRMNLDGSIPDDNPFANSYVYSYGHRNPQGLAWSTEGVMYATEHGQSANDEVNEIQPGENYGWPIIEGTKKREGMRTPRFTSGQDNTWAPSGMAYYRDSLYVATLRGTALLAFDLQTNEVREVINHVGRIRDVWIEGDKLYFITNNTDGRGQPTAEDDRLYQMNLLAQ